MSLTIAGIIRSGHAKIREPDRRDVSDYSIFHITVEREASAERGPHAANLSLG